MLASSNSWWPNTSTRTLPYTSRYTPIIPHNSPVPSPTLNTLPIRAPSPSGGQVKSSHFPGRIPLSFCVSQRQRHATHAGQPTTHNTALGPFCPHAPYLLIVGRVLHSTRKGVSVCLVGENWDLQISRWEAEMRGGGVWFSFPPEKTTLAQKFLLELLCARIRQKKASFFNVFCLMGSAARQAGRYVSLQQESAHLPCPGLGRCRKRSG